MKFVTRSRRTCFRSCCANGRAANPIEERDARGERGGGPVAVGLGEPGEPGGRAGGRAGDLGEPGATSPAVAVGWRQAGPPRPSPFPLAANLPAPVAGRSGRARASRSPGSVRRPAPLSLPAAGARCRSERAGRASAPFPLPLGGKSACPVAGRSGRARASRSPGSVRPPAPLSLPAAGARCRSERASGRASRQGLRALPPSPWRQICLPGGREKRQSEGVPEPRLRSAAGPAVPGSRWRPVPERGERASRQGLRALPPSPWRQICLPGGREKRQSEGVPEPRLRSAAGPAVPGSRWRPVPERGERASRQGLRALPPFPLAANLPARWPGEAAERGRPGAPAPFGRRPRCPWQPLAPGAGAGRAGEQAGPPRPSPLPLGGKSACPVAGRSGRARASRSPGSVRPPAPLSLAAAGAR
ncbi:translation initiation factor IF-2-like, partial [Penaeus chinensis]|uniref:translation initiation factor IF-2-like n=1 Tax=Penaeus chinensis TaxID=139456 RepID=UPI001FB56E1C